MNASTYKGFAPYSTPAMRADRAMRNALGDAAYSDHRAEREAFYRDLIRKVRESK